MPASTRSIFRWTTNVIVSIRRRLVVVALAVVCCGAVSVPIARAQPSPQQSAQAPQQPQPQDGFVPVSELPPQDQFPAARLLVAAYSFVIFAVFMYVVSIARRLTAVQREVERLEADVKRTSRA